MPLLKTDRLRERASEKKSVIESSSSARSPSRSDRLLLPFLGMHHCQANTHQGGHRGSPLHRKLVPTSSSSVSLPPGDGSSLGGPGASSPPLPWTTIQQLSLEACLASSSAEIPAVILNGYVWWNGRRGWRKGEGGGWNRRNRESGQERESLGTRSERAGWERLASMSSGDVGWLRNGSKERIISEAGNGCAHWTSSMLCMAVSELSRSDARVDDASTLKFHSVPDDSTPLAFVCERTPNLRRGSFNI